MSGRGEQLFREAFRARSPWKIRLASGFFHSRVIQRDGFFLSSKDLQLGHRQSETRLASRNSPARSGDFQEDRFDVAGRVEAEREVRCCSRESWRAVSKPNLN